MTYLSTYQDKKPEYSSEQEKSEYVAEKYHQNTSSSSHRFLAYRDVPPLIVKYVNGQLALDFGSGTGISTQFIMNQGFQVTGADVSKEMLKQSKTHCPNASFFLIENDQLPFASKMYDFVFSSFVLLEMESEKKFIKYLSEAKRVMKQNGIFMAVTGSSEFYSHDWYSFKTDYPENNNLRRGDKAKICLLESNMEFTDYYWSESDCCSFFEKSGLSLIEILHPLGKAEEPFPWKEERHYSPFAIFVAKIE